MKKGFYELQYNIAAELKSNVTAGNVTSLFTEKLDSIEDDLDIMIDNDPACVSVASFLFGFCGNLASYFNKQKGYPVQILFDKDGDLVHAYNIITKDGKDYYLDCRGITDDKELFESLYSGMDLHTETCDDIKTIRNKYPIWDTIFTEDEISEAMIKWLIDNYDEYYNI